MNQSGLRPPLRFVEVSCVDGGCWWVKESEFNRLRNMTDLDWIILDTVDGEELWLRTASVVCFELSTPESREAHRENKRRIEAESEGEGDESWKS